MSESVHRRTPDITPPPRLFEVVPNLASVYRLSGKPLGSGFAQWLSQRVVAVDAQGAGAVDLAE
jgi:hypothetical protein